MVLVVVVAMEVTNGNEWAYFSHIVYYLFSLRLVIPSL